MGGAAPRGWGGQGAGEGAAQGRTVAFARGRVLRTLGERLSGEGGGRRSLALGRGGGGGLKPNKGAELRERNYGGVTKGNAMKGGVPRGAQGERT